MAEILRNPCFWFGVIFGVIAGMYLAYKLRMIKKINIRNSVKLAEELQTAFRKEDIKGIKNFRTDYLKRKQMYIFGKSAPSAYQLWAAIIIYIAHRYADYDYNSRDSKEWTEIVEKTFGNKSIAISKFKAANEILNYGTKYMLNPNGNLKTGRGTNRDGVYDHGDNDLYEMVGYIIDSSFETTISFDEYYEVQCPSEN